MAELIKCMECGGMVSSEANQCPHCKTGSAGINGVKCHACGSLLKLSEAITFSLQGESDYGKSEYFHNSCYQQISRKIEKKQTINCPICAQPNQFSYVNYSYRYSMINNTKRINCANCGHPYEYKHIKANDPYASCTYCGFLLEKDLAVKILNPENNKDYYAHKLCNNKERQAQELEKKKYYENREMMRNEEKHKMRRKEAMENSNGCLQQTLIPMLILGGFCIYLGGFSPWLFGVSFTVYIIALIYMALL